MRVRFTKMHGAGNDFVMLDGVSQPLALTPARVKRLADRHFGVGADQVLLVEPAPSPDVDFRYRIFNADGNEVEQCGNGARCFVKFVRAHGLTDKRAIRVATLAGVIEPRLEDDGSVTVDMGVPRFDPAAVPFDTRGLVPERVGSCDVWTLDGAAAGARVSVVSMGNPHAVLRVDEVDAAPVATLGAAIETHPRFARRTNVGFMQVLGRDHVRLRVWERGVGETLACGSGACAAVAVGVAHRVLADDVQVDVRGGRLRIRWAGADNALRMSGPAEFVFDAEVDLA